MMNFNNNNDDEFAPNPFRSGAPNDFLGGSNNQPLPSGNNNNMMMMMNQAPTNSMPPPMMQPTQQQQQPDPYSGMTGTLDMATTPTTTTTNQPKPVASPTDPALWTGTMDQRAAPTANYGSNGTTNGAIQSTPFNFFSLRSWIACCTLQAYQPYFDVDTSHVTARLRAAMLQFYAPDHFRTAVVGDVPTETLKGPDLYGPVWIALTLVFVLAACSNIYDFWEHAKAKRQATDTPVETFQVDIYHLMSACNVVLVFVFGLASAFWMAASCLGLRGTPWALWVCVYGYSQVPFVLACIVVVIFPLHILTWTVLAAAGTASGMLVLRNLATPLMAQDAGGAAKAGPLILAMLASHFIYVLVIKFTFFAGQ